MKEEWKMLDEEKTRFPESRQSSKRQNKEESANPHQTSR